ncbi:hypothetical protein PFISCL1PPCAC_1380, partial [Pristionchus fissidentatus]
TQSMFLIVLLLLPSIGHAEFVFLPGGELTKISTKQNDDINENCGFVGNMNKINNGAIAKKGQFPWAVAIESNNGQRFCSGTIISPRHVLTAAHCVVQAAFIDYNECQKVSLKSASEEVDDRIVGGYVAYGGTCNFAALSINTTGSMCKNDNMKRIKIRSVAWERQYRDKPEGKRCTNFDVAIIETATDFEFGAFARPACLLASNDDYSDATVSFYGFGHILIGENKIMFPDLRYGSGIIQQK